MENLYEFVVSNVDVEIRLAAMLDQCSQYKNVSTFSRRKSYSSRVRFYENQLCLTLLQNRQNCDLFDECITRVKAHCLSSINKLVDGYARGAVNSTAAHHNITLSRLKFFKTFYLSVENL